ELIEENIIPAIKEFLKPRGLELSEEKTRIVRIEEGFDFLGQHLQKYRNKLIITPTKENLSSFLEKVRNIIRKCYGAKTCDMIKQLNAIIRGWAYYHRYVQSSRAFSIADKVIFQSLWRWIKRRHPLKSCGWIIKEYFNHLKQKWKFCCKIKDRSSKEKLLELIKPSYVKLVRYIKIKGEANPFNPKYLDYFIMRKTCSNVYPIS
ncbi:hypothetical protein KKH56_00885, partial [bacterium]|nr:hypothetical protein [bacterium]